MPRCLVDTVNAEMIRFQLMIHCHEDVSTPVAESMEAASSACSVYAWPSARFPAAL